MPRGARPVRVESDIILRVDQAQGLPGNFQLQHLNLIKRAALKTLSTLSAYVENVTLEVF